MSTAVFDVCNIAQILPGYQAFLTPSFHGPNDYCLPQNKGLLCRVRASTCIPAFVSSQPRAMGFGLYALLTG